ncbi:hypothetical protein LMG24238_00793 [Paraburkholderia sediminicola]|uniref:PXPV repeat-containing protein n=1 Tax=Paraburkholderia sediminicola TaxID=458836 RepID=A0A6J4ZY19_9BURK|nr:hypothetical protein [Paraburkholderia sediminicola]CAB3646607.1 hypothetical protein LMG24238_00793 [Paraburkholderia sediminicola]
MKVQPLAIAIALFLLTAVSAADAQEMQPSDVASHSSSQQPINSPQRAMPIDGGSTWDYGAQPGGRNGYGKTRDGQPCVVGLSCDIYQGS